MYSFVSYSLPGSFILPSGSETLRVRQRKRWSLIMGTMRTLKVDIIPQMLTQLQRSCRSPRYERSSSAKPSRHLHHISVLWGNYYFNSGKLHWFSMLFDLFNIPDVKQTSGFFFQVKLWHSGLWGLLSDCQIFGLHEAVCTELWYLFITGKRIHFK